MERCGTQLALPIVERLGDDQPPASVLLPIARGAVKTARAITTEAIPMIRVLCVDDEPAVLRLLETSLAKQPDVSVVPGALDPGAALERLRTENIDVLVMDYNLRGEPDGLELVRRISQMGSSDLGYRSAPEVVFCTGYGDDVFEREAICLGAAGVVRKECAVRDLAPAVRAAASGTVWRQSAPA